MVLKVFEKKNCPLNDCHNDIDNCVEPQPDVQLYVGWGLDNIIVVKFSTKFHIYANF